MYDYQAPEQLLKDRVILVTGAGDGIGKAAAKAYAAAGATVILLGRTLEKLEQVYDEIEAAGHPQPALVPMNLESASEHDYQELAVAGVETLVAPFTANARQSAIVHFPGGYIAEIHAAAAQ